MEQFINLLLDRLEDKTKTIAQLNDELRQYEQLSTQQSEVDNLKDENILRLQDVKYPSHHQGKICCA